MKYRCFFLFFCFFNSFAQQQFTQQDSLRGSITAERAWWDVQKYHLEVEVFPTTKSIRGKNTIHYLVKNTYQTLQIELQAPLVIDSIVQNQTQLSYNCKGISYFINLVDQQIPNSKQKLTVYYHGKPKEAVHPPWDGGFVWSKTSQNSHFIATANQSIGASVWWPCKDHPADEPKEMLLKVTCPSPLLGVSNGKCISITKNNHQTTSYTWEIKNPINAYGVSINIANYAHYNNTYKGKKGNLECNYYVLPMHLTKAKKQFQQAHQTLEAFEYWLGPYPFYNDGYKLVEVPYLGMEHQSCIGYGNQYKNGYLGKPMGTSNWGLKFDYILVHESGHEWFANSVTCKDVADLWIHESFTTYAESLFVDYFYGTKAANEYVQGLKPFVKNDTPIVGTYNVHNEGSTDMYMKGSLMLHTLRQMVNSDEQWRSLLKAIQTNFYHKTVSGKELIDFIDQQIPQIDVKPFFKQYLTTTKIPEFFIKQKGNHILYKWHNTVVNFNIPLKVYLKDSFIWLRPKSDQWMSIKGNAKELAVDPNFYVHQRLIE